MEFIDYTIIVCGMGAIVGTIFLIALLVINALDRLANHKISESFIKFMGEDDEVYTES